MIFRMEQSEWSPQAEAYERRHGTCHVSASRIPTLPYLRGLPSVPARPPPTRRGSDRSLGWLSHVLEAPTPQGYSSYSGLRPGGVILELHGKGRTGPSPLESKQKSHQRSSWKQEETTMDNPHSISRTLLGKPLGESDAW